MLVRACLTTAEHHRGGTSITSLRPALHADPCSCPANSQDAQGKTPEHLRACSDPQPRPPDEQGSDQHRALDERGGLPDTLAPRGGGKEVAARMRNCEALSRRKNRQRKARRLGELLRSSRELSWTASKLASALLCPRPRSRGGQSPCPPPRERRLRGSPEPKVRGQGPCSPTRSGLGRRSVLDPTVVEESRRQRLPAVGRPRLPRFLGGLSTPRTAAAHLPRAAYAECLLCLEPKAKKLCRVTTVLMRTHIQERKYRQV